ncbi:MAG TPA: type II CAAX endopeptidase family protein [Acidimicrobiia bacterium]|nr:type II CAAX endopeptidase family protein [Acidimicrobiia bacterium]
MVSASEVDASAGRVRTIVWAVFSLVALLLLNIDNLALWTGLVVPSALLVALIPGLRPSVSFRGVDGRDLLVIGASYAAVVGLFRVAFTVFTTDNVLGLFLSFGFALVIGVVGPIVYQVWMRGRDLRSLGLGFHGLRATLMLGSAFAAIQFASTLWGYHLPAPVEWLPLLVMSLVVGLFEAIFFRGFIQGRLEESFGVIPAVGGAALLYALYHVGYGMPAGDMWFLFGLGVLYAIIFRLTTNILILWPLLTPLGAFFNNLQAGDIELPWESILGFADVAIVMAMAVWLAHRHIRKRAHPAARGRSREEALT